MDTLGNMEKFKEIYPNLAVLARSRPEDKYALVTGLMKLNHVVAVTGIINFLIREKNKNKIFIIKVMELMMHQLSKKPMLDLLW